MGSRGRSVNGIGYNRPMEHFAPYTFTVAPSGRIIHQSGGLGMGIALAAGGVLVASIVLGVAPAALVAHYGFGVGWTKSIAISVGIILALGAIHGLLYPSKT